MYFLCMRMLSAISFFCLAISCSIADELCSDVLVSQNTSAINTYKDAASAWLSLIDQDNYEKAKMDASAKYKVIFKGNFENFKEKRQELYKLDWSSVNTTEARKEITSSFSSEQIMAWSNCMSGKKTELYLADHDSNNSYTTVAVIWTAGNGIGPLRKTMVNVIGAAEDSGLKAQTEFLPGSHFFTIKRSTPGGEIRVTINGIYGEQEQSKGVSLIVPAFVAKQPMEVPSRSEAFEAASLGDRAKLLDILIRGWNVNTEIDNEQNRMLHRAAEKCYPDFVKWLLDGGADRGIQNIHHDTANKIARSRCGSGSAVAQLTQQ